MENVIIELFVRGLVLCLLTAMALVPLRRTAAAYRHLICVLALAGLLILPLAQRLVPPLRLLHAQRVAIPERAAVSPQEFGGPSGIASSSEITSSPEMGQLPIRSAKPTEINPTESSQTSHDVAPLLHTPSRERRTNTSAVLITIWALGAATLQIRLMVALFRLRRLKAESRKETLAGIQILTSDRVKTPLTWGIRRPVILLPAALLSGDLAACDSALRHEQAHIARWDWMWNLLAELVCALCWFQPGAWWLRSRMRLESERACDDRVLLSGVAGPDYAAHLLKILLSACTGEIAPAMAQSGGMEERVKHILDTAKPRRAQIKWLAVSAPFALCLLSLAALRVSARPTGPGDGGTGRQGEWGTARVGDDKRGRFGDREASDPVGTQLQTDEDATALNSKVSPSLPPVRPTDKPGTSEMADAPQADSAIALKSVVWGKAVDGLVPGFLITTPGLANDHRVPLNSHVAYKVLVRNTTHQDREFEVHCRDISGMETYLIPDGDIRKALGGSKIPENYRAGGIIGTAVLYPAYVVKLAPGEAVVLPEEFGLYVGDADKQSFPRMESVKAGKNWIVQPITIQRLTGRPAYPAPNTVVMTVDRAGKTTPRSIPAAVAGSGGTQLFARIQVEVATVASVVANGADTAWGKERNGLQLGLRLPKGVTAFPTLSQARFEVVLRNGSDKPTRFSWMGYPTVEQFSPELFTPEGKPIQYIKTIAGPYMDQATNLAAGETVAIGTISLPHEESHVLDAYPAGTYSAEFELGASLQRDAAGSVKARIAFTLTGLDPASLVSARPAIKPGKAESANIPQAAGHEVRMENVVWGPKVDGLEPGFMLTTSGSPNNRGVPLNSLVKYKVLVRNTTTRERIFELRCVNSNGLDVPYLIPGDAITEALSGREIPTQYRAANLTELYIAAGAYDIELAPGETVVVPTGLSLYIGDADKQSYPRVETIKQGVNWIVQPISIRKMSEAEVAEAELILSTPYSQKQVVAILDRKGNSTPRSVPVIGAGSGGKQLFAKIQLEIGPIKAEAVGSANAAI